MKKRILATLLAAVMALSALVVVDGEETQKYDMDPAHLTFTSQDDLDAILFRQDGKAPTRETEYEIVNGELRLTLKDKGSSTGIPDVPDPCVYFTLSNLKTSIKAEDYPYIMMVYRIPTDATSSESNATQIFCCTDGTMPNVQTPQPSANTVADGKYHYALLNPGAFNDTIPVPGMENTFYKNWTGTVTTLRLDYFLGIPYPVDNGDTIFVRDIMFFKDESTAKKEANAILAELNLPAELTLSFNLGDHGTAIPDQTVKKGENPVRPDDPTSDDGYVFDGWYTSRTYSTPFNFDTPLMKERVLVYAKWVKGYTVTFNCGDDESVVAPAAQSVKMNDRATLPDQPERSGYTFAGWYADPEFTEEFDFNKLIKEDTVVYAKWKGQDYSTPDWGYTVSNGEATINRYYGSETTVTIPSTIDGYPVTALSYWNDNGSYGGIFYGKSTKSVTIPDSVTTIGYDAFYNCTSLTSVTIPDSVTTIGVGAFADCTSLESVTIPGSVTTIGDEAFYGCTSLTSVTISDGVTTIGEYAFYGCTSLASVTIPDGMTSISYHAFYYCTSLTSVTIPDSVTTISDFAFFNCSKLNTVYYTGSQTQWKAIYIGSYNIPLKNATKVYNYNSHVHDYSAVVTPATCTAKGYTTYTCTICGEYYVANEVPALGHSWSDWEVFKAPNCETQGTEYRFCYHDGTHYEFRAIPALGHDFGEWTVTTPATCFEEGVETRVCSHDPSHVETRTIPVVIPDPGDATGDGKIDVSDVILIAQYMLDDAGRMTSGADVNGNGSVTISDLILLSQYLLDPTVVLGPQD